MGEMHESALWTLSATGNPRFPYRIEIRRGDQRVIALWVQDKWPGSGKQIFCLREGEPTGETSDFTELERVRVNRLERYGKQLSVILDRPNRKRCNFLFLEKPYKNQPGTYEQIFFRTQGGMQQHRSSSRVHLRAHGAYRVVIDSSERYPWKFAGPPVERRRLPAGDYALEVEDALVAVAERKTFENLLTDFAAVKVLHAKLDDLTRWDHAAMVIEAEYRDFLNPQKLKGRWPATHAARVLAELHVLHPRLQIVYAGSRKSAEQWCSAWFAARAKERWHRSQDDGTEAAAGFRDGWRGQTGGSGAGAGADAGGVPAEGSFNRQAVVGEPPAVYGRDRVSSAADSTHELRRVILSAAELPEPFTIQDLRARFPDLPDTRIRSMLHTLRKQGRIERVGGGRNTNWRRCYPE